MLARPTWLCHMFAMSVVSPQLLGWFTPRTRDAPLVQDGKLLPCGADSEDPSIAAHQTSICRGTGRTIFQLSWGEQKDMREQVSVLLDYQTSRLLSVLYNGRRSDLVMHS